MSKAFAFKLSGNLFTASRSESESKVCTERSYNSCAAFLVFLFLTRLDQNVQCKMLSEHIAYFHMLPKQENIFGKHSLPLIK